MTELVEKVARAICTAGFHDWPDDTYPGRDQQRYWRSLAKSAIDAVDSHLKEQADDFRRVVDEAAEREPPEKLRELMRRAGLR